MYGSWNGKAAMRWGMTLGLKKKYGIYVSAFNLLNSCPFFSRLSRSRETTLSHCILHRRNLSAVFSSGVTFRESNNTGQSPSRQTFSNLQYDLVTMTGKKMVFRYVDCLGENNVNLMQLWMSGLRGPGRPYQTGRFRLISESHSQTGCSVPTGMLLLAAAMRSGS